MWTEQVNLKFMVFNAENLFLLFHPEHTPPSKDLLNLDPIQWRRLSTEVFENKPIAKCRAIADLILKADSDIVCLTEVGGADSLNHFNQLFLDGKYSHCLIEGNSDRNIDVGFLLKKNHPFYFDLDTNKNFDIQFLYDSERKSLERGESLKASAGHFTRDVAELKLFQSDREKPFLVILLTHLKSRLDPERIDPNGFSKRQAEMKALVQLTAEVEAKYPQRPFVICGDFNGNAGRSNTDREFKIIYEQTKWDDVLEVDEIPQDQRATYFQIKNSGLTEGRQIDFAFLNEVAKAYLKPKSSAVLRYLDEFGFPVTPPTSLEAKNELPSDHYPLVFELSNLKTKI